MQLSLVVLHGYNLGYQFHLSFNGFSFVAHVIGFTNDELVFGCTGLSLFPWSLVSLVFRFNGLPLVSLSYFGSLALL